MARATVPRVHHLVGVHEIAKMLGVTRQRVLQLADEDDFPAPDVELHAGRRIWLRVDVEAWAKKNGRTIHDG